MKPTNQTTKLTLIVAVSENNVIGKDNELVWRLKNDLKRFKELTSGHCIIMGRKTFESFPNPLPNRTHIVITRQADYKVPSGVIVVNNMDDALDAARNDQQPFIIGGGEIYKQAFNHCQVGACSRSEHERICSESGHANSTGTNDRSRQATSFV